MRRTIVAALAGLVFAFGLALSGMTNPGKVIAFLDVTGAWDPSLAFVMGGAIGVHFLVARWTRTARAPLLGGVFSLPKRTAIEWRLVGGSALFGLGWGAAGYCPGPALVSVAGLSTSALVFTAAMVAGMAVFQIGARIRAGRRMFHRVSARNEV